MSKNGGLIFKVHFLLATDVTQPGSLRPLSKQVRNYIAKTEKDPLIHRKRDHRRGRGTTMRCSRACGRRDVRGERDRSNTDRVAVLESWSTRIAG